jgi:hypothetical protein
MMHQITNQRELRAARYRIPAILRKNKSQLIELAFRLYHLYISP